MIFAGVLCIFRLLFGIAEPSTVWPYGLFCVFLFKSKGSVPSLIYVLYRK